MTYSEKIASLIDEARQGHPLTVEITSSFQQLEFFNNKTNKTLKVVLSPEANIAKAIVKNKLVFWSSIYTPVADTEIFGLLINPFIIWLMKSEPKKPKRK